MSRERTCKESPLAGMKDDAIKKLPEVRRVMAETCSDTSQFNQLWNAVDYCIGEYEKLRAMPKKQDIQGVKGAYGTMKEIAKKYPGLFEIKLHVLESTYSGFFKKYLRLKK